MDAQISDNHNMADNRTFIFLSALVLNRHNLDNSIFALILEHNNVVVLEIKTEWVEHERVVGGCQVAARESFTLSRSRSPF